MQLAAHRDEAGRFVRTVHLWTPARWNEGHVDARGYFRVFRPDYPRAWKDGYAKRYAVVWWLKTGEVPAQDEDIHHENENTLDDRFENLKILDHAEHSRRHRTKNPPRVCLNRRCGRAFVVPRNKSWERRKFCSFACYNEARPAKPRSQRRRAKLTGDVVREIRRRASRGTSLHVLVADHNVSWTTIYNIVARKSWRHL